MDQPAAKKRRLAPKVEPQASPSHPPPYIHDPPPAAAAVPQQYQVQELVQPPERHDFESFARHLQDAAMLIYRQSQRSPYNKVSVLLLRWEDDAAVEPDLAALEQVFRERYHYRTHRWTIPVIASPSLKLGVRISSFLEPEAPDHLFIVYYAGYSFVGVDKQLFWASDLRPEAPKLKWNGLRCLFEQSQSDMLLILDAGTAREQSVGEGSSLKQVIATNASEQFYRDSGARSFTASITEALSKLSGGRPFTAEHLYQEAAFIRQQDLMPGSALTNGTSKSISLSEKLPMFYTMTSGKSQNLILRPLSPSFTSHLQSPPPASTDGDIPRPKSSTEDFAIHPSAVADLTFDEPRVLVCTTFVGEASPDMSSFRLWLHNSPPMAAKIAVEGMFLGPPTMLLISMPVSVWNVVQHDKVCCFLGYVNSHNMTHLYKRLVGSMSVSKPSAKDVEDGRMLLEAREVAVSTPVVHRQDHHRDLNHTRVRPKTPLRRESLIGHDSKNISQTSVAGGTRVRPKTPLRRESLIGHDSKNISQTSVAGGTPYPNTTPGSVVSRKDEVEDSAEMQEAAEQLKALSHVRHLSDASAQGKSLLAEKSTDIMSEDRSPLEANESGGDEANSALGMVVTPARPKQPRRSLQKQVPKQETRCSLCTHSPFKDSSSLRKHIAAAHTRPFPCAFAFAGCNSTFGSKNEWKRHIASQHLCLTYYRCSSCPQSTIEGKGNEFNRKDLFTQHLRRMHAPFAIKKAIAKGDSKLQSEWEAHVKDMQHSCLVTRRQPPQRSACPKPDCASVFEGPTSWDEWTEHVGRHMEKGEASRLGVDRLLAKWALDEGVIERKDDGEYRLCSGNGASHDKESKNSNPAEDHSDGNKRDPEDRTIVAASTMIDKMDVDI